MAISVSPLLYCIILLLSLSTPIATSQSQPSLRVELDQLKSKISLLESSIKDRVHELGRKDERIKEMEQIFKEKSDSISSLQLELESYKIPLDAGEQGKAHVRAVELEKQIEKLKKEIQSQNKKRDELEARANEAERKIQELNSKLENLQNVNDEQKTRIHKTKLALQVAEEELMKAKFEVASRSQKLVGAHGGWLPHWLEVHLDFIQSYVVIHWKEHGKPALYLTMQKASEKKAQVERWAEPIIERIKTEWIPSMKEKWLAFISSLEPHIQTIKTKTIEVYHVSKSSLVPQLVKLQTIADPYILDVKKHMDPYFNQVVTVTRPHYDNIHLALNPYVGKVVYAYKKSIKYATMYHHQIQKVLKNNEFTKPLATMDLAWFVATALWILPVIFLHNLFSAIFCKKGRRHSRNHQTQHQRRRAKRPRYGQVKADQGDSTFSHNDLLNHD